MDATGADAGGLDAGLPTVGVLGGMSSQSTVEYYRLLDAGVNDALGGHSAAEILIRSVNFAVIEQWIRRGDWEAAGEFLADAALDLEVAGADFVLLATNTMHRVAPAITDALSVPFLHIVDVTAAAIHDADLETVGVLGTSATMEGDFYRERFADHGIDVVVPDAPAREAADRIIFEELTHGDVHDESRATYLDIVDDLVDAGAEGIVLGCTELDLLLAQSDRPTTPFFDTTALHVDAAVARCLDGIHT